jgi:putative intracellular protease/amidase
VSSSTDEDAVVAGDAPAEESGASFGKFMGLRSGISRRMFLGRGSMIAGVAAAVATVPGLGALLTTGEQDAPAFDGAASEAGSGAAGELGDPVVAHVVNASTGEINLYQGTQLITTRNPALAQALARLAAAK